MKRFSSVALVLLVAPLCIRAQSDLTLHAKPKEVTLYLSGALVKSQASGILKEGTQTLVFTQLPSGIDPQSVQVKSDAQVLIYSVDYQLNYLQAQDNKAYRMLEDSLRQYKAQHARLGIQKQGWIEEIALLQANRSIGGANSGVNTAELNKMTDFVRARITAAGMNKLEIEEKETKVQERIRVIEQQLVQWRNESASPTGEVYVQLSAGNAGNANFELSYFTHNSGWAPLYDVRIKEVGAPAQITAKAMVYQNTGQDWKNVKLSLCTGNPSLGNNQPVLNPWTLYLVDQIPRRSRYEAQPMMKSASPVPTDNLQNDMERASSLAESVVVDRNTATNSIFKISTPFTISSNGKEHFVEIQNYSLKAEYVYFSVPKLDRDAFLLARISDWNNSELLSGDANIYFENNYVGKSWFDTQSTEDTLSFGLGRDNQIQLERKQVKDFTEKNFSGSTRKTTRSYEISVKNTRKSDISLNLEDQIPLSSNEQIGIELVESSGASLDKQSGKLSWKLNLKPGESRKLVLTYSVKYPKNVRIQGM